VWHGWLRWGHWSQWDWWRTASPLQCSVPAIGVH
jgi:hypothetical protein